METVREILRDHWEYKSQLTKLAKSDLNKTYKGSLLGWAWALIRPAILIFVFWFAFTVGLRHGHDVDGYPFFLWLIAGMIPWYYMRDMLNSGSNSIRKYRYLVTKIKFPVSTIPTFVSMANLAVNTGLIIVMIFIFWAFGYAPTVYYLQIPFYILLMFLFWTAWGLFSGIMSAMSSDFLNLVRSLTQALFWLSGILYDARTIDQVWIRKILLVNPVTLLINGFRNVFISHQWFWEQPGEIRNFLIAYIVMCLLAVWAYKKLRKELPDVL